jgi:hypothetical protein
MRLPTAMVTWSNTAAMALPASSADGQNEGR